MNIHDLDIFDMFYIVDTNSIINRLIIVDSDFSHPNYIIKKINEIDNIIYQNNVNKCRKWFSYYNPKERYGRIIGDKDCSICSVILEMYNIKLDFPFNNQDTDFLFEMLSYYKIDCMNEIHKLGRYDI